MSGFSVKAKALYRQMRLAWRFVTHEEMRSSTSLGLRQRLAMLRLGFLSQTHELYNLKDYELSDYFSDWAKARMSMMYDARNIRGGYQYGLNNKLFSTAILGQYLRVPTIYAIIEHGQIVPLAPADQQVLRETWIESCEAAGGTLVLKPSADGRGRGVFMLSLRDGALYLDDQSVTEEAVNNRIASLNEYIIVEFLRQGAFSAGLYPETTNTIRVVTVIDPDSGAPYLPIAVQRIGRLASRPVDNWNRGGLCAEVDLATGVLSRAASREGTERRLSWYDTHPDTGLPIAGQQVPDWDAVKTTILAAAARLAYFKFLSWDVVLLDHGIAIIEADTVSGIETLQVHRPLLRDERLRRFFAFHGYVSKEVNAASASTVNVG